MKIITRYTLTQIIEPFSLALLAFTSVLLIDKVFVLTKYFVEKGINLWYMVEMLFYYSPAVLVLTFPMAVLVGIVTAFGRMSADNEIVAMKTSGVGMHRVIIPVVVTTLILSGLMVLFMDFALPKGNKAYTRLYVELRRKHPALVLEPDNIMEEMSRDGKKWYFKSMDEDTGVMKYIRIWERVVDAPKLVTAKEGKLNFYDEWTSLNLYDGKIYQADKGDPKRGYAVGEFEKDKVILEIAKTLDKDRKSASGPRNMSIKEIKEDMKKLDKELKAPSTRQDVKEYIEKQLMNEYRVELHKKIAIPFACLVFGLIGVPLGLIVRRGGRMVGLGIGVSLIIVYYVFLTVGEKLAEVGAYPPFLGAWTPNIIIGTVGIILIIRTVREAPIRTSKIINKIFPQQAI